MHLAHLLIEEDSLQEVGPKKTAIKWILRQVQEGSPSDNLFCYNSQLKCIFQLQVNVLHVVGQNSLTP